MSYLVFGTEVFGVNVIDEVLNETNYARSPTGYLILCNRKVKMGGFFETHKSA